MGALGRWLIGVGLVLVLVGSMLVALSRNGFSVPHRLPGDIAIHGRNWAVFLPLGTSLAVSVLLSLVLYLVSMASRH